MARSIDPRQSVTNALNTRRGFATQADTREQARAMQRLGGSGDVPQDLEGPLNVKGDQTITEGLLRIEIVNDDVDGLDVGPVYEEGIGDYYTLSYKRESGLYVFKLLNGGGFPSFQITQEITGDSTVDVVSGTFNVYDGIGNIVARIDSSGNLTVNGNATLGNSTTDTITLTGHLDTKGSAPSVAVGANAATGGGSSISIAGNDTNGTITLTTGASAASGSFCDITFNVARASTTYTVQLTPQNANASQINWYSQHTAKTVNGCQIRSSSTPTASAQYIFDYWISE